MTTSQVRSMANVQTQTTIIPHNQEPYVTRTYPDEAELDTILQNAATAQTAWRKCALKERLEIGHKFVVCTTISHYYLYRLARSLYSRISVMTNAKPSI